MESLRDRLLRLAHGTDNKEHAVMAAAWIALKAATEQIQDADPNCSHTEGPWANVGIGKSCALDIVCELRDDLRMPPVPHV